MTVFTLADKSQSAHTINGHAQGESKNVAKEQGYWNSFYAKWSIDVPSQFCVLAATEISKDMPIVEFGCGNSRDSIYLSKQGFRVHASDLSEEAIAKNREKVADVGAAGVGDKLSFSICNCTNAADVGNLVREARVDGCNIAVYNRFFLHSIDEAQEKLFFRALASSLVPGDKIFMEFRCSADEALPKVYGKDHYRRYIETPKLLEFLDGLQFEVEYERTGQGMAKYKSEDPFVSRIIANRR
jgi:hypothetical protein